MVEAERIRHRMRSHSEPLERAYVSLDFIYIYKVVQKWNGLFTLNRAPLQFGDVNYRDTLACPQGEI